MDEVIIRRVREAFGCLGNMSPHPIRAATRMGAIVVPDIVYPTSEALFQALRYGLGSEEAEEIRAQKSPMAAKMVARRLLARARVEPRSTEDVDNMRKVLRWKLDQHDAVRSTLVSTGTARIIEDCTRRPTNSGIFWGARWTEDGWDGCNVLGELWMDLRNAISRA